VETSRQGVLVVLGRALRGTSFLVELVDRSSKALESYELDSQEAAVLVSGDLLFSGLSVVLLHRGEGLSW
jgi:precorrin-6B methylase 1